MSLSPAVVKNTQNTLGRFVKRPPLTEKLLSKPPFRFLHDVISVVIRDTGALKGLFTDKEMNSDNVKDRESKLRYLQKAIACVSFATDEQLSVKPTKVVSGHEPEKTNEFLQALGRIIEKKIDTADAVERVLSGEKPQAAGPGERASANQRRQPDRGGSNRRGSSREAAGSRRGGSRGNTAASARGKDKDEDMNEDEDKNDGETKDENDGETKDENDEILQENGSHGQGENGLATLTEDDARGSKPTDVANVQGEDDSGGEEDQEREEELSSLQPQERPKTVVSNNREEGQPQPKDDQEKDEGLGSERDSSLPVLGGGDSPPEAATVEPAAAGEPAATAASAVVAATASRPGSSMRSARPRTGRLKSAARPPSARPAAPRLKEKAEIQAEEELQARPKTGKVANVILATGDGGDDDDDDGEEFLVEEKAKDDLDLLTEAPTAQTDTTVLESGGQEHGALVQQILETQKELEDAPKTTRGGVEIERESGLSDLGRRRDREATQREVSRLRESIQTLTRSANPLGKLMDFLQEDVDQMQRELETWKKENQKLQLDLKHEQKLTEKSIEPLKVHLADLETAVGEELDKISAVKANILKNEERISRMMSTIGTAAR